MKRMIKEMDKQSQSDVYQCSNAFTADAKLCLHYENGGFQYTVEGVTPFTYTYARDEINLDDYMESGNGVIFLAYDNGKPVGQIIVTRWWNQLAYVTDIAVDPAVRGQGIGTALMRRAEEWASAYHFPGLMLETQDYNVRACQFYEKYGFQIGGFDLYAYKGIRREAKEIPIYWYYFF